MLQVNLRELPRVTVLGQVRQQEGWSPPERIQSAQMMIFLQEGDMTFRCGQEVFILAKGDYFLLPPGTTYAPSTEEGCLFHFVHFELVQPVKRLTEAEVQLLHQKRQQIFLGERDPSAYALPMDHHEYLMLPMHGNLGLLQDKIWLLLAECDMHRYGITPPRKTGLDLRIAEILNLLDLDSPDPSMQLKTAPPVLSRILLYIHQHYSENVTLARLSAQFELSKQYIAMLFREYVGTSVTQYVNRLKLDHSLDLLHYSSFRIGEIAERLGFSSAYYFGRLFRKHFGMTPSEYIRMAGGREQ